MAMQPERQSAMPAQPWAQEATCRFVLVPTGMAMSGAILTDKSSMGLAGVTSSPQAAPSSMTRLKIRISPSYHVIRCAHEGRADAGSGSQLLRAGVEEHAGPADQCL